MIGYATQPLDCKMWHWCQHNADTKCRCPRV